MAISCKNPHLHPPVAYGLKIKSHSENTFKGNLTTQCSRRWCCVRSWGGRTVKRCKAPHILQIWSESTHLFSSYNDFPLKTHLRRDGTWNVRSPLRPIVSIAPVAVQHYAPGKRPLEDLDVSRNDPRCAHYNDHMFYCENNTKRMTRHAHRTNIWRAIGNTRHNALEGRLT